MESSINTEDLVNAYLQIRTKREAILREYERADNELKAEMSQLEAALLNVCNSVNADSIKTSHGTVMRKLSEKFVCSDWDNFYKFVLDNEALHLLHRRINNTNLSQYLSESEGSGLPPGINVLREYSVSVRKVS